MVGSKMLASAFANDLSGLLNCHGWLIWAARGQGIKHIGQRHDACRQRDIAALFTIGVALARPSVRGVIGQFAGPYPKRPKGCESLR